MQEEWLVAKGWNKIDWFSSFLPKNRFVHGLYNSSRQLPLIDQLSILWSSGFQDPTQRSSRCCHIRKRMYWLTADGGAERRWPNSERFWRSISSGHESTRCLSESSSPRWGHILYMVLICSGGIQTKGGLHLLPALSRNLVPSFSYHWTSPSGQNFWAQNCWIIQLTVVPSKSNSCAKRGFA